MKYIAILTGALFVGAVAAPQAQATLIQSGTAILGDVTGTPLPTPEDLTVNYSVNLTGSTYTYSYTINNPAGDVVLGGQNNGNPEIAESFNINFNTGLEYIPGSATATTPGWTAGADLIVGLNGLTWQQLAINNGFSQTVTFQSPYGPVPGAANASDASPPAPWSSLSPNGQMVPVPQPLGAPDGGLTVALLGGSLMALGAIRRIFRS
jgi:hypothetical protein